MNLVANSIVCSVLVDIQFVTFFYNWHTAYHFSFNFSSVVYPYIGPSAKSVDFWLACLPFSWDHCQHVLPRCTPFVKLITVWIALGSLTSMWGGYPFFNLSQHVLCIYGFLSKSINFWLALVCCTLIFGLCVRRDVKFIFVTLFVLYD